MRSLWIAPILMLAVTGCDFGAVDGLSGGGVVLDPHAPARPQLAALVAQGAIAEADVNRDGIVDIRDLILVAQSFGQIVEIPPAAVDIVDVQLRVTEKNDTWWRQAWRVTLRNNSPDTVSVDLGVEFQDADGFIVDADTEYGLSLESGAAETFTGFGLVSMPWAETVAGGAAAVAVRGDTPDGDGPAPGDIDIVDLAVRVTEKNNTWWRFAWQLTLVNDVDRALVFGATVEFQDGDGFIVDVGNDYGLQLADRETRTFAGFALVRMPSAETVALYAATIR
ncbi:hypothetical protein HN371_22890 [Candidatus Poribacteria bacterium]|jgi:hypothetical protein|nr:hypothetical protein [Candidatus Poribacteria bacterium]MBT5533801.1 hypothetical protein [Candidatus Poribacteria bacterium]MBT5711502.1 hypothetical protein [Candidatus Poribacteria bacterium]MBT7099223.1 hypothetical protein [Candidatus Poribacteria bacterium]MBT7805465.1 hypothetical protein [Candidatus Poribacteria bacterium]